MVNYKRNLKEAWDELENQFRNGDVLPQQENDVVCFLYHVLVIKLEKEGIQAKKLKTEDTIQEIGRIDMNLNDRLYIEVRLLSRKNSYGNKVWNRKKSELLDEFSERLNKCNKFRNVKHARRPALLLWNWKAPPDGISDDLESKLKALQCEFQKRGIILLYGPRKVLRND